MFNYSTAYMKSEPLSSEKQKQTKRYFEDQGNYFIAQLVRDNSYITTARNYYSSKRDVSDFQFLEDVYGLQNPIDISFTNIIKPRVDALVGLSLLSAPEFSISYVDADTIKEAEEERMEAVIKDIDKQLSKHVESQVQQGGEQGKGQKDPKKEQALFLTKLQEKYGEDFQSSYAIGAQHILKLIETDSDIDLSGLKKKLSKDYFITGQCYTRTKYEGKGKNPTPEYILAENLYTNRPRIDTDLKRADGVVHKRMLRPHQILKEFGNIMTTADAVKIFGRAYSTTGSTMDLAIGPRDVNTMDTVEPGEQMDTLYMSTGYSNGGVTPEGAIYPVYHVEWLASTKISNGEGGYFYREDRYEVYRIGSDIYVGGRRCDEAPRRKDSPWKTRLSYDGLVNHPGNGHIVSIVLQMKELQDLYDIIMFFRNNMIATSGVSGSRVNVAAIPKALGKKFMDRLTKWLTIRKQGVELIDPTEEGAALFQHYGDFDASVDGNSINGINAVLESLTAQADIISGVPRQVLGVIEERDAVENVRVGMNQVSVLSLEMFRDLDSLMAKNMQSMLDAFKYSYRDGNIEGVFRNGIALIPFVVDNSKFALADHLINVVSAGIENSGLVKIQQLAAELLSGGMLDPDVVVEVMNTSSIEQAQYIIKKGTAAKKEEMANLEEMNNQLEQASTQIKQLEAEIERLKNNSSALDKEKIKQQEEKNKKDIEIAGRKLDIDEKAASDKNKIAREEIALKHSVIELEKEQLLMGDGNQTEINNNKV